MSFLIRRVRRFLIAFVLAFVFVVPMPAIGPIQFDGVPAVSIYRDFDDGLFGRSLYRGVVLSVKLESFSRYDSFLLEDDQVLKTEGLTAYLLSGERAQQLASGLGRGVSRSSMPASSSNNSGDSSPENYLYSYENDGILLKFSLEQASEELFREIQRTYPVSPDVADQVAESYRQGYVLRIHQAENVYRPEFSELDYEDILISASLIADKFQPLWGIHDGNDVTAP